MPVSDQDPVLDVRDLTREFDGVTVLDKFSFQLKRGEVLGLLGANGAGKTTAMNMLLGLTTPSSGSIHVFGLDLVKHRIPALRRMNFSSAYTALPGNLYVWQNLTVFARIYGVPNPKKKIEELLELFEITDLRKRVTGQLSAGESTRLNLCKALLNDPDLLLLDEPTASLDARCEARVNRSLQALHGRRTVVLVSHNPMLVRGADQILVLEGGSVSGCGSHEQLLATHRWYAQFVEQNLPCSH